VPADQRSAVTEEADQLRRILRKHNWHRQKAARELGIDRTTLWRKIKKYNLTPS
jgi:transcriptional regulator of acetoin/glycerol metabolism